MGRRVTSSLTDFSGGVIGGVSPYRRRVRHMQVAENVTLRPLGAMAARKGSQRLTSATLTKKPHTVMEWVTSAGTGHIFVGTEDTNGVLYEATSAALNVQTLPYALGAAVKMVWDQLNGALWVTENSGANPPMFYRSSNPANTFHTGILPRPAFMDMAGGESVTVVSGAGTLAANTHVLNPVTRGATTLTLDKNATATGDCVLQIGFVKVPNCQVTIGSAVVTYDGPGAAAQLQMTLADNGAGGLVAGVQYWYRLRYRYFDGSSRASVAHTTGAVMVNTRTVITNIANEIRSDYLGWTLERTKQGGSVNGPFYFVADSATATTTAYNDVIADADLGYRSDENVHGEPPHFDGVLAYKDRLVAWAGSTLYVSQSVADIEATGIANWNALSASLIGPDDGDIITKVVRQVDRLVVLKRWSGWGVEGDDITSFRVFPLFSAAGCSGPRAAASVGSDVYFWGDAGFHRLSGNSVEPFGWVEVGHLFDTLKVGQSADVVVKNYLGQHILVAFSSNAVYNDDMLVYDLRFRGWTRFTGWYVADMLVQKAGSFGNAQAVVSIDRRDLDTGAGFDYPIWMNFFNYLDEKTAAGAGGSAPTVALETPWMDDGTPTVEKDWERIQLFISGTSITASVTITMDPDGSAALSVSANQSGAVWDVPTWDNFTWANEIDSGPFSGVPSGTFGRRYRLRVVTRPTADFAFKGYALDGIVQPTQDYSGG